MMKTTCYTILSDRVGRKYTVALVPDIHNKKHDAVITALRETRPDVIAVAGDLMMWLAREDDEKTEKKNELGFEFLKAAASVAPTFYSLGNHEAGISKKNAEKVRKTGAVLLDNDYAFFGDLVVGGLSSASCHGHVGETPSPSLGWLDGYEREDGFRLLLCHHPEYYPKYLKDRGLDAVLAGHAHGGQWRFFGHGIYAPGQGLFPKLTSGIHDGKLVISRGLANHVPIPRLFNGPEFVLLTIKKA